MNYRELKEGEVIQEGDEYRSIMGVWELEEQCIGVRYSTKEFGEFRRPIPEVTRPTKEQFDEASNFDVVAKVSHEAVSDYEISQHSADEVIYATDTKADVPMPICWRVGDECVINQDRYIIRNIKEVYTVDQIGNKWSFDASYEDMARPERNARQVAIDEALEVFTGMISPSENQLGVLYDAGYLLPKKDD